MKFNIQPKNSTLNNKNSTFNQKIQYSTKKFNIQPKNFNIQPKNSIFNQKIQHSTKKFNIQPKNSTFNQKIQHSTKNIQLISTAPQAYSYLVIICFDYWCTSYKNDILAFICVIHICKKNQEFSINLRDFLAYLLSSRL